MRIVLKWRDQGIWHYKIVDNDWFGLYVVDQRAFCSWERKISSAGQPYLLVTVNKEF